MWQRPLEPGDSALCPVPAHWVELIGHHAGSSPAIDFDSFARQNPALLDKRLLSRFYRSSTLASHAARTGWVEPDLAPFPWKSGHS